MLIQLIGGRDDAEFDAMTTRFSEDNGQRPYIATAYPEASTTSLVMIAFRRPPGSVAAGSDLYRES